MRRTDSLAVLLMWLASAPVAAGAQLPEARRRVASAPVAAGVQAPDARRVAGSAANLVPLASAPLALKSEAVELTFLPEARGWDVSAHFEVGNLGERALSTQLALPEFRCDPASEFDDQCVPAQPGFTQLTATVRGRTVQLRKSRAPAGSGAGSDPAQLWDFPLRLEPNESASIDLQYAVPAGVSTRGGWSASYHVRGAASWARPIGRASFKFNIPAHSCLVIEPEKLPRKSRRVLLRAGEPWLELVFEAYVWNPPPALALYFETCLVARDTELPNCPAAPALQRYFFPAEPDEELEPIGEPQLREALAKLDTGQLTQCRDAVFEAYAGYFAASELKRLPSHRDGQRHYTAPLLTEPDWNWIHYLDDRLAERPAPQPMAATKPQAAYNSAARGCGCNLATCRPHDGAATVPWLAACGLWWPRRGLRRCQRR